MKNFRLIILLGTLVVTATIFYHQVFIISRPQIVQNNQPIVLGASEEKGDIESTDQPESITATIAEDPADNGYFRAQVGTYWIYEGQGSELDDGVVNNYKIKFKNEVISVSGVKDDYLLRIKTTNLLDMSTKEGVITIKKDYVVFDSDGFYNYVRFPLKVGSRWPEDVEDAVAVPLRADGFYQNRINWKLNSKVLGNDCYNIIQQGLSYISQTIWCNNIGPIQDTYHHNGSLDDVLIRLTGYHF